MDNGAIAGITAPPAKVMTAVTPATAIIAGAFGRLLAGEIDYDLAWLAGDIIDFDAVAITILQLRKQGQRVVIVAENHGFARMQ